MAADAAQRWATQQNCVARNLSVVEAWLPISLTNF